nr:MAG TPA: hypothetical protein [Caudoviricetes sp.]
MVKLCADFVRVCVLPQASPLPPSPPPPSGGSVVVEDSDTINLSGSGTTDDPLRAELAFPLRINLASTTYDEMALNDWQMVYKAVETFSFVNDESAGEVSPLLSTTLTVTVDDIPIGDIVIDNGVFTFTLDESQVINPDNVVKIVSTEAIVMDFLSVTLVGNVTP